ncbi:MAG: hypothetical protein Q8L48_32910 [Archangium sp.]|nr:hypothetical protein [Archangium sp.]
METSQVEQHPIPSHALVIDTGEIIASIAACTDCEVACFSWADECLGASLPASSLRRDLACADNCGTTARLVTSLLATDLQSSGAVDMAREQLTECARSCATCERECLRAQQQTPATLACAEACRRCEDACRLAADALG